MNDHTPAPLQPPVQPTVGRIVHYYDPLVYGQPLAALITRAEPHATYVDLCVFYADRIEFRYGVTFGQQTYGCWTWPPRT